jgi:hypothetical protein
VLASAPPGLTERAVKARASKLSADTGHVEDAAAGPAAGAHIERRYRIHGSYGLLVRRNPSVEAPSSYIGAFRRNATFSAVRIQGEFVKVCPTDLGDALRGSDFFNPRHDPITEGWVRAREGSTVFLLPDSDRTPTIEQWGGPSSAASSSAAASSRYFSDQTSDGSGSEDSGRDD